MTCATCLLCRRWQQLQSSWRPGLAGSSDGFQNFSDLALFQLQLEFCGNQTPGPYSNGWQCCLKDLPGYEKTMKNMKTPYLKLPWTSCIIYCGRTWWQFWVWLQRTMQLNPGAGGGGGGDDDTRGKPKQDPPHPNQSRARQRRAEGTTAQRHNTQPIISIYSDFVSLGD